MSRAWETSQKAERNFWQHKTNRYPRFAKETWAEYLRWDDLDFSFFAGKRIVELGCGPFGMIHFMEEAAERIGVDPLIDAYRSMGLLADGGVTHLSGKGERIDLPGGWAEVVISYNVLDHVEDPAEYLREAWRLLAPGGCLYLNCHTFHRIPAFVRTRLRLLDRPHPWHFSGRNVGDLVSRAGFHIERTKEYPLDLEQPGLLPRLVRTFVAHRMILAKKI